MRIEFHPDVYKQLQRLPRHVFMAALDAIVALADNPRPPGIVKLAGGGNAWRIRIGQYRIVYDIDDDGAVVTVFVVAKRSDAYR